MLGVIAAVTKVSDSNLRIVGILRGISDDTDKQLSYYKEITSISQETGANTETLADLYRKTIPVLKQEGDAKLVAEAVGLSKAVYNLSTENVKDGVTQLTQALGLGYFRAEEFTGVHENLGLLLQKVAERTLLPDGTQATVASLKLLANKGEYKNEDFLGGLRIAKDDIGGELTNTPYTISRGFDQFKQRFGRQIKELEEKDGRFERSGLRIGNVLGSTGIDKLTESLYEISSRFVKFATDLLENSPKIIKFTQEKYAEYKDKTVVFLEKLNFIVDQLYHAVIRLTESLPKVLPPEELKKKILEDGESVRARDKKIYGNFINSINKTIDPFKKGIKNAEDLIVSYQDKAIGIKDDYIATAKSISKFMVGYGVLGTSPETLSGTINRAWNDKKKEIKAKKTNKGALAEYLNLQNPNFIDFQNLPSNAPESFLELFRKEQNKSLTSPKDTVPKQKIAAENLDDVEKRISIFEFGSSVLIDFYKNLPRKRLPDLPRFRSDGTKLVEANYNVAPESDKYTIPKKKPSYFYPKAVLGEDRFNQIGSLFQESRLDEETNQRTYSNSLLDLEEELQKKLYDSKEKYYASSLQGLVGFLTSSLSEQAKYSREAFNLQKAFQIGQAIISTAAYAIEAYGIGTKLGGTGLGAAFAGAVVGFGTKNIDVISSQQFQPQGRRFGGSVSRNTMYEVNEGGMPEILSTSDGTYLMTGASQGNVIPLSSGNSPQINVNVQNPPNYQAQVREGSSGDIGIIFERVDRFMGEQVRSGRGSTYNAMRSTFGMRKRA